MNFARGLIALTVAFVGSGCAIRMQPSNPIFDQVAGRGPMLLVSSDGALPSVRFFEENRMESASLGRLVERQGAPEAISVEREFLRPTKLKLFYPSQNQVYILSREDGQWFVIGSEPFSDADSEALQKQRVKRAQAASEMIVPTTTASSPMEVRPVAHALSDDFRGRLKPPSKAEVADLSKTSSGDYVHRVSFAGETLFTIAEWYTDDGANARALVAASKRAARQPLRIGDRIVIPRRLMTNTAPLPEAVVP